MASAEERLAKIERLLFPEFVQTKTEKSFWKKGENHNRMLMQRCWPGTQDPVTLLDENKALIYLEPARPMNGNKPRIVCEMNRGITLYAKYLPIYKDVIEMLETVQKQFEEEQK